MPSHLPKHLSASDHRKNLVEQIKFGLLYVRTVYFCIRLMAEGVGFEPTVSRPTSVFKTGAFVRSAIPPWKILVEKQLCLFTGTGALGLVQNYFTKSYRFRCYFNRFVFSNEFTCLLK